jgi:hypothetical protein
MDKQVTLDVRRFLDEQFGGVPALLEKHPLWPYDTAIKWRQRNSMRGQDLATLLAILEKRDRKPVSVAKYITEDSCPVRSKTKPSTTGNTFSVFD